MNKKHTQAEEYYTELYRPQYHFTPESNWMNDPNGMVYYNEEYHLFYQYHPHGTTWGPMHWGHAVSKDLVHWEHLPIALAPDEHGAIFSGSAVVDWNDTSGFFNGGSGLVAIFTHADQYPDSDRPRQRQSLAYSTDDGRTWTMYEGNPVLAEESITDFRDPKVFWHEGTNRWVMMLASGQTISIYTSSNLIDWEFASEFGAIDGSHDGVWECPDLFQLSIDGDETCKKWVLLVSIGDNPDYEEGSRTQYFIGEFDGTVFHNDNPADTTLWLDYGRDNYAGVSWSDVPKEDGRRMYVGWMSNWRYANITPTKEWRSAMTLPRELFLGTTVAGVRLFQKPVEELQTLREKKVASVQGEVLSGQVTIPSEGKGKTLEIIAEFEWNTATEFGVKVRKSDTEETVIGYDTERHTIFVDRTHSGESAFSPSFAGKHEAVLNPIENKIKLHIFVDCSSVEVFVNDGEIALSDLIFPDPLSDGVELYAKDGEVKVISLEMFELRTVWR